MPERLRLKGNVKRIYEQLKREIRSPLQWTPLRFWDLGNLYEEMDHAWRMAMDKRIHGLTPMLAEDVRKDVTTVRNLLNRAQNIREKFPLRKFVAEIEQLGGTMIHFKWVFPIKDAGRRQSLLKEAVVNEWSTEELIAKAKKLPRIKGYETAGAKVRTPKDIKDALMRLVTESTRWVVWAKYCFDEPGYIDETRLATARKELVADARKSLEELDRYASQGLAVLRRGRKGTRRRATGRSNGGSSLSENLRRSDPAKRR